MVSGTDAVAQRGSAGAQRREPWFAQEAGRVVAAMDSDADRGLSGAEAAARLSRYGPNGSRARSPRRSWRSRSSSSGTR